METVTENNKAPSPAPPPKARPIAISPSDLADLAKLVAPIVLAAVEERMRIGATPLDAHLHDYLTDALLDRAIPMLHAHDAARARAKELLAILDPNERVGTAESAAGYAPGASGWRALPPALRDALHRAKRELDLSHRRYR
jgi:hypothetical protein